MNPIRIATRRSALALWQAEHVAARLRSLHPGRQVVLVPMTTRGDRILDRPLAEIGGKGLFLKELEVAMQAGEADIAVHSMKDVPMQLEPGFAVAAILERADPHDAFVSNEWPNLASLPPGARVGTSSLRRRSLLRALRPDLQVEDLRGNVNTRLARLDKGEFAAIILACAGLLRLGFADRIRDRLPAPEWLPAVAQGAIGIEIRDGDSDAVAAVAPLADAHTTICVSAERAMNRVLQGSCDVPIAGHALLSAGTLRLEGLVGDPEDGRLIRARGEAPAAEAEALGERVAAELLALGAEKVLRGRRSH